MIVENTALTQDDESNDMMLQYILAIFSTILLGIGISVRQIGGIENFFKFESDCTEETSWLFLDIFWIFSFIYLDSIVDGSRMLTIGIGLKPITPVVTIGVI